MGRGDGGSAAFEEQADLNELVIEQIEQVGVILEKGGGALDWQVLVLDGLALEQAEQIEQVGMILEKGGGAPDEQVLVLDGLALEQAEQVGVIHEDWVMEYVEEEYAVERAFPAPLAPHLLVVSRVLPARFQRVPVLLSPLQPQMADRAVEPGFLQYGAPLTAGCTELLSHLTNFV